MMMKEQLLVTLREKGFGVREIASPVDFLKAWNEVVVPAPGPVAVLTDPVTTAWLDAYDNICWIPDDTGTRSSVLEAGMGITGVTLALAKTGTLLLAEDSGWARLVSNMVPVHIALIPENCVVLDWRQALDAVNRQAGRTPRIMSWISGPSQTADIQGTLVKGMHGPLHIEAWLVPGMKDAPLVLS